MRDAVNSNIKPVQKALTCVPRRRSVPLRREDRRRGVRRRGGPRRRDDRRRILPRWRSVPPRRGVRRRGVPCQRGVRRRRGVPTNLGLSGYGFRVVVVGPRACWWLALGYLDV